MSLQHFVNDGLMAVFFLLVGLEIKRELLLGELASVRRAALPVAAAIGGMVVPALLYAMVNFHGPGAPGWGIPMATDIAFAVGVVALVGRSLPVSVKVFLLAIAIVDDLGAVAVIALFYTKNISLAALGAAGGCFVLLILLNLLRVHAAACRIWCWEWPSGSQPCTAESTRRSPGCCWRSPFRPRGSFTKCRIWNMHAACWISLRAKAPASLIASPRIKVTPSCPLEQPRAPFRRCWRVEHALLKPVSFFIVPVFALANAGVDLRGGIVSSLRNPIALGVMLGLLLGKPWGICYLRP